jgi:hypothetical protein
LTIVIGAPLDTKSATGPIAFPTLPKSVGGIGLIAASRGGVGLFAEERPARLYAVDLSDGKALWNKDVHASAGGVGENVAFVSSGDYSRVEALALTTGRVLYSLDRGVGTVVGGVFYIRSNETYSARDAATGRVYWQTRGVGYGVSGPPIIAGRTLYQHFVDSGAILHDDLYALDVETGRPKWVFGAQALLEITRGLVFAVDTWAPRSGDAYFPLSVAAIDANTGKRLREYDYRPDPSRYTSPDGRPILMWMGAERVRMAGGYLWFWLSEPVAQDGISPDVRKRAGTWYRYDADVPPQSAHASRVGETIVAVLPSGDVLLNHAGKAYLGHLARDRIDLHRLASSGPLRSDVAVRSDGARYVIAGNVLLALGSSGPRAIGTLPCGSVGEIVFWSKRIAVRCPSESDGTARIAVFNDPVPMERRVALTRPHFAPAPRHRLDLRLFPIPAPSSSSVFSRQWDFDSVTAVQGGVAFVIRHVGTNELPLLARTSASGTVRFVPIPGPTAAAPNARAVVAPGTMVVDSHETLWFNDLRLPMLTSVTPSDEFRMYWLGDGPLSYEYRRGQGGGVRIATGPDGEVWFARSHPQPQIGRVDVSAVYSVPAEFGEPLTLVGGGKILWFASNSAVGTLTPDGKFQGFTLPADLAGNGPPLVAAVPSGTAWIARGAHLALTDGTRILRRVDLPTATAGVAALAAGCDGSAYVAEMVRQVAWVGPDGPIEEFPLDGFMISGLARAGDCSIWFGSGRYGLENRVGTLRVLPR